MSEALCLFELQEGNLFDLRANTDLYTGDMLAEERDGSFQKFLMAPIQSVILICARQSMVD